MDKNTSDFQIKKWLGVIDGDIKTIKTMHNFLSDVPLNKSTIVLTVNEIVLYTGYKKSYIYKLAHQRKIPHYKPATGRKLFFSKSEIDDWLLAIKQPTEHEIK